MSGGMVVQGVPAVANTWLSGTRWLVKEHPINTCANQQHGAAPDKAWLMSANKVESNHCRRISNMVVYRTTPPPTIF